APATAAAPTRPARPMAIVKNSNTISDNPTTSSRNTMEGLVRECSTEANVPSLRKLTGWSAVWRGPPLVSTCLVVVRWTGPAAVGHGGVRRRGDQGRGDAPGRRLPGTDPGGDRHLGAAHGLDQAQGIGVERAPGVDLEDDDGGAVGLGLADRTLNQVGHHRVDRPLDLDDLHVALGGLGGPLDGARAG